MKGTEPVGRQLGLLMALLEVKEELERQIRQLIVDEIS